MRTLLFALCLLPALSVAQPSGNCRGPLVVEGFVGGTRAILSGLLQIGSALLQGFVYAVTALAAQKALRWARTMENAQSRDEGMAESQLWGALGPMQGPLQYCLEQLATDGHVNLVVHLTRSTLRQYFEGSARASAVRVALDGTL